jgi:hypothetical protein
LEGGVGMDDSGSGNKTRYRANVRVSFVVFRKRELDRDNLVGGLKHLRDAVAASLGLDDADHLIAWEYAQIETKGRTGVVVRIESIP